jgi:uncharacterized protein
MKDLLETIIKEIVDTPDQVKIEEIEENGITSFMITVAPEDMGKVIGKGGKIIKAIRNIMKIKAIKEQKRIMVNLVDHEN